MTKLIASGTSLAERNDHALRPWEEPDWQRLWLATQREDRPWRSLAVVPGGRHLPPRFVERAAVSLSRTGTTHLGASIHVADATRMQLVDLQCFLAEIQACTSNGLDRVVIALAPLLDNVTSVSIAQQCDRALLCVLRGITDAKEARRTVSEIGARRFIGSVMFEG